MSDKRFSYRNLNGAGYFSVEFGRTGTGTDIILTEDAFYGANNVKIINTDNLTQYALITRENENANPAKLAYENGLYTTLCLNCQDVSRIEIDGPNIKSHAFSYLLGIRDVICSGTTFSVEEHAFDACSGIKYIEAPVDAITNIFNCVRSNRLEVVLLDGNSSYSSLPTTFKNSNIVKADMHYLNGVSLASREIQESTFENCTALKSVVFGGSLEIIGKKAFKNCKSLTEIEIPASVRIISELAFDGCDNLKKVKFSGTKAQWKNIAVAYNAFSNIDRVTCSDGETDIYFAGIYKYIDGQISDAPYIKWKQFVNNYCTFNKENRTLTRRIGPIDPIIEVGTDRYILAIHPEVQRIGDNLLYSRGFNVFDTIVIPADTTFIGQGAFDWLSKLREVDFTARFPGTSCYVSSCFTGCDGIREVKCSSLDDWLTFYFEELSSNPVSYSHTLRIDGRRLMEVDLTGKSVSGYSFAGLYDLLWVLGLPGTHDEIKAMPAFANCPKLFLADYAPELNASGYYIDRGVVYGMLSEGAPTIGAPVGANRFADYALSCHPEIREVSTQNCIFGDNALFGCGNIVRFSGAMEKRFVDLFGTEKFDNTTEIVYKDETTGRNVTYYIPTGIARVTDYSTVITAGRYKDIGTITEFNFGGTTTTVEFGAFAGTNIDSIILPSSLTTIEPGAFMLMPKNGTMRKVINDSSAYEVLHFATEPAFEADEMPGVKMIGDGNGNIIAAFTGIAGGWIDTSVLLDTEYRNFVAYSLSYKNYNAKLVGWDTPQLGKMYFENNSMYQATFEELEIWDDVSVQPMTFGENKIKKLTASIFTMDMIRSGNPNPLGYEHVINTDSVITAIPDNLFKDETELEMIEGMDSHEEIQSIGERAFSGVPYDATKILANNSATIGRGAFSRSGIRECTVTHSKLSDSCFSGANIISNLDAFGVSIIYDKDAPDTQIPGGAFGNMPDVKAVKFYGTMAQWRSICPSAVFEQAFAGSPVRDVVCDDGNIFYQDNGYIYGNNFEPIANLLNRGYLERDPNDEHRISITTEGLEFVRETAPGMFVLRDYLIGDFSKITGMFSLDADSQFDENTRFSDSTGLVSVSYLYSTSDIVKIPNGMFAGCSSVKQINIVTPSNTIEEIGEDAFLGCSSLKQISGLPNLNDIKSFGDHCLKNCGLIPQTDVFDLSGNNVVESIGEEIVTGVTSVKLPSATSYTMAKFAFGQDVERVVYNGTTAQFDELMRHEDNQSRNVFEHTTDGECNLCRPRYSRLSYSGGLVECSDGYICSRGYGCYFPNAIDDAPRFCSFEYMMEDGHFEISEDGILYSGDRFEHMPNGIYCFPDTVKNFGAKPSSDGQGGATPIFYEDRQITGVILSTGIVGVKKFSFYNTKNLKFVFVNKNSNGNNIAIEEEAFWCDPSYNRDPIPYYLPANGGYSKDPTSFNYNDIEVTIPNS